MKHAKESYEATLSAGRVLGSLICPGLSQNIWGRVMLTGLDIVVMQLHHGVVDVCCRAFGVAIGRLLVLRIANMARLDGCHFQCRKIVLSLVRYALSREQRIRMMPVRYHRTPAGGTQSGGGQTLTERSIHGYSSSSVGLASYYSISGSFWFASTSFLPGHHHMGGACKSGFGAGMLARATNTEVGGKETPSATPVSLSKAKGGNLKLKIRLWFNWTSESSGP